MEQSSANKPKKRQSTAPILIHPIRAPVRILPLQQRQGTSTTTRTISSTESSSSVATSTDNNNCPQKRPAQVMIPVQEDTPTAATRAVLAEESMDSAEIETHIFGVQPKRHYVRKRKRSRECSGPSLSSCYNKLVDVFQNHPSPLLIPGRGSKVVTEGLTPILSVEDDSIKKEHPIEIPTRVDVLFGRGMCYYTHLGNRSFRQIVALYGPTYCTLPQSDKPKLAKNLVQYIRWQGGRFLMREHNNDDSPWYECGDEKARLKVGQGLRDSKKNLSDEDRLKLGRKKRSTKSPTTALVPSTASVSSTGPMMSTCTAVTSADLAAPSASPKEPMCPACCCSGSNSSNIQSPQPVNDTTETKQPRSTIPLSSYYSKLQDIIPNHPSPLLCPCICQKEGSSHLPPPPPAATAAAAAAEPTGEAKALPPVLSVDDDSIKQEHPIRNPSRFDVLLGRGNSYYNHLGNRFLLRLTELYHPIYCALPKADKPRLAQNLVQYIRWQGGRFLTQGNNSKHPDDGSDDSGGGGVDDLPWYDCGDKQARMKVAQRLRDSRKDFKNSTKGNNINIVRRY